MSYKIIMDSCGELPENLKDDKRFERIALVLTVGDYEVMDDDTFDQKVFLEKVAACEQCPHSACPSPASFAQACETEADHIYIITLSSHLSGSYNSAVVGSEMALEKNPGKKIAIIDSQSASVGLTQLALKVMELEEAGKDFEQVVESVNDHRDHMKTYFVLDNLETLRKNGRMSKVKAMVASTLRIKPVMSAIEGTIIQMGQGIGTRKALAKMVDYMMADLEKVVDRTEKSIMISHCNCLERAESVRKAILDRLPDLNIQILDTAGISSMYANDGGIILTAMT